MNFLNALKSVVISIKDWVNAKLKGIDNDIAIAKRAGDDAQANVDALEIKVGDIPSDSNAGTIVGYIDEKTKNITSGGDVAALTQRVTVAENDISTIKGDHLKKADKTELENKIEASKQEAIATVLGETIHADFDTLQEVAEWIQNDTTNSTALINRVTTIEGDYLTSDDKTELEADIEDALTKINELDAQMNGVNILSEPIEVNEFAVDGFMSVYQLGYSLGCEYGKSYAVNYTYNGEIKEVILVGMTYAEANNSDDIEGVVVLKDPNHADFSFYTEDGAASCYIIDKSTQSGEELVYNENDCMVMVMQPSESAIATLPFALNSITEVRPECASKESLEELQQKLEKLSVDTAGKSIIASISIGSDNLKATISNIKGATRVNWGDGIVEDLSTTTFSHTYINKGSYRIVIEGNITEIGTDAFRSWNGTSKPRLTYVVIPSTVTQIGTKAFSWCQWLQLVVIPYNSVLSSIGSDAFEECDWLMGIQLPPRMTGIYDRAFYGCQRLTRVELPSELFTLNSNAFISCARLREIYIPERITELRNDVFSYCRALSSVTAPHGIESVGQRAFSNCSSLEHISLKLTYNMNTTNNTKRTIYSGAFSGCTKLKRVTLDIGYPLTISGKIFDDKTSTTCERTLEITNIVPPAVTGLSYIQDDIRILVPRGSLEAYRTADGWKDKASQITCESDYSDIEVLDSRVKALEGGINLLSTPIAIAEIWNSTQAPIVVDSLGIEIGKTYKVTGYYGIEKVPFEYTANTTSGPEDFMPIPEGASYTRLVEVSGSGDTETDSYYFAVDLIDCSEFTGSEIIYNAEMALLACTAASGVDTVYDNIRDVVIESVIEAKPEYLTKEGLSEIEGRLSELESKPVPVGDPLILKYYFNTAPSSAKISDINVVDYIDWGDGSPIEDVSGKTQYTHNYNNTGVYVVKVYGDGLGVYKLGNYCFKGQKIISVQLPHRLDMMHSSVFENCSSLEEIVLPRRLSRMWNKCFSGCTSLKKIEFLSDTVKSQIYSTALDDYSGQIVVPYEALDAYKEKFPSVADQIIAHTPSSVVEALENRLTTLEEGAGGASNLLSESVTIPFVAGSFSSIQVPTLNLVEGDTYSITYTYKGETVTVQRTALNGTSSNNIGVEGAITLGSLDVAEALLLENNTGMFLVVDKCNFVEGQPSYSADTCALMMSGLDEAAVLDTLVIESIAEAPEEYATVSYVDNIIAEINNKLESLYGGTEV